MINIYEHSIDNYIDRVMNVDVNMAGDDIRLFVRELIKDAVNNPDEVYSQEEGMPPIYIKDDAAVVVATSKNGDKYIYDVEDNDYIVPTVYNKETFIDDEVKA